MNFTNVYSLMMSGPSWGDPVYSPVYTKVGFLWCASIVIILIFILDHKKVKITGENLLLITTMFVVVICNFLPGVHDRYMLLADIMSVLYVISSKRWKDIWIPAFINFVSAYNLINYLFGCYESVYSTRMIMIQLVSVFFLAGSLFLVYYVIKTLESDHSVETESDKAGAGGDKQV